MQLSASAPIPPPLKTLRLPVIAALRSFFNRRTFVGFRIGEALLWFCFVVMWPAILAGVYFFSGLFDSVNSMPGKKIVVVGSMPVNKFVLISSVVVITKAIVMIPFWWLFFVKWKLLPVWKRALLHLPVGAIYSFLCVYIIFQGKTQLMNDSYPRQTLLLDGYNMLTSYFMNFILFHAYNFWLSSQRQKKKEQDLRELAFQSEINALKTQIEPHFLFNTLNSISASVPPSLEKTRVLISQLADTFRYALRVSESQFVRLGDEIEFMKTWLALEKQRFGSRLVIYYEIDKEAMEAFVPPMILQPLVENALNHGLAPKIEGGVVTISCVQKEGDIEVAVADTGVGYNGDLDQIFSKSVGLSNISRRLKLLYDESLHVSRQDEGLRFSFLIPYQQLHEKKSSHYR